MRVLLPCSRLALALALILVLDSSVQGLPARRARYQWVRCTPDSMFANCIDEKGPVFDSPPGESNRIPPPRTDPFSMASTQNLNDVFPLSEDYSGSGSGSGSGGDFLTGVEHEYQPVDKNDAFYYDYKPVSSNNPDLGQNGLEENFIM
ncbi:serglycin [Phyllostomus discolor]|uniref:Serglycin n=1 Tax=Phyllostomus discolor TaxID=89673 RepID=A0A6J2LPG7_9CHIR|nr:serglycin [Phyllostomus discolor]KAF6111609.1 serglycin [Phyllostomus discolor]